MSCELSSNCSTCHVYDVHILYITIQMSGLKLNAIYTEVKIINPNLNKL